MPFKTFAPGVLTSSDVNTFLMRQAVVTCTAATRPASPSEGMTIYQTDTNTFLTYDGSNWVDQGSYGAAWTAYTPTLSGTGWAIGNGTLQGRWMRRGTVVTFQIYMLFGSTTTKGGGAPANGLRLTLPVALSGLVHIETGYAADVSTGTSYALWGAGDTNTVFVGYGLAGAAGNLTAIYNTTPFTWDTNDYLYFEGTYEMAPA